MAKDTENAQKKPQSPLIKAGAWVLMGLLVAGLGGFGVTNLGGSVTTIGRVGDQTIDAQDYAQALQAEVNALSQQVGQTLTTQQAIAFGIDKQALQGLVTRTALDNEAASLGVSVGDQKVATEVTKTPAFAGTAGTFDREAYRFALDRANLTEAEFEDTVRRDLSRALLQGAVAGGFTAPAALTDTLYTYIGERRGLSLLRITEADLPAPLPEPDDAALQAFHAANTEAMFTRPEARRITYAALLPDSIAADQPADEAAIRALYEARLSEFMVPEKRLVERLIYPDDAAAQAARAKLDAGASFEDLVAERGLTLADIDRGDVTKAGLGAAGDGVFALAGPGVAGPLPSDLGPALYRMNAILAAQETTFEQARDALALESQAESARDLIAGKLESIDDLLAGGAALADLQAEMGMTLASIDYVPGAQTGQGIAAYPAFRAAADTVAQGDFPQAIVLDDGGIVAMQLDAILPPAPIPYADATDDVAAKFRADALTRALAARATEVKSAVEAGASLGAFGIVQTTPQIARDGTLADAPPEVVYSLFQMAAGDLRVIETAGFTAVLRADSITPAAADGEAATALKGALAAQVEQALAADAFAAFTRALTAEAGISLDQTAINAVNAQFQ